MNPFSLDLRLFWPSAVSNRHSSSSSAFPAISLGCSIFGEIFAYVIVFLNPTIEVVTFRFHG